MSVSIESPEGNLLSAPTPTVPTAKKILDSTTTSPSLVLLFFEEGAVTAKELYRGAILLLNLSMA